MANKKLNIVSVENKKNASYDEPTSKQRAQANYEKEWFKDPDQYNAHKSCLGRNRVLRTWDLIQKHLALQGKKVADLGCGHGIFSVKIQEAGAQVDAVDIAAQPLNDLRKQNHEHIHVHQDYIPHTVLPDNHYDLVLAADLIAELPRHEYRLFMSELSRLTKKEGLTVCSTPLDIYSEDALERFMELFCTEFEPEDEVISRHAWYIKILNFLKAPHRFVKGSKNEAYRKNLLSIRMGLKKSWFSINTAAGMRYFWQPIAWIFNPLAHGLEQWDWGLLMLEKLSQNIAPATTMSHVIVIGKKRALFEDKETPPPLERIYKQRKWE